MKWKLLFLSSMLAFPILLWGQAMEGIIQYTTSYKVIQEDRPDLEMYKDMIPSQLEMWLRQSNSLLKFKGGTLPLTDILYRSSEKCLYTISHTNKSYQKNTVESLKSKSGKSVLQAKKTNQTQEILGYKCLKYLVTDEKNGTETILWCTTTVPNASSNVMAYFLESMTQYSVTGLSGLPLKIEFHGSEFNLTLLAEKKELKKLASAYFELPKGYTNKTNK